MEKAGSLIREIIRDLGMEEGMSLSILNSRWPEVFGPPLGGHMFPVSLKGGELLINVDSPAWLNQINYLRSDILHKVKSFGVTELRFRIGRVPSHNQSKLRGGIR